MLTLFARHSLCDLTVEADGDIEVDFHHTVEDTGIALGQAFAKALGDKRGIRRYGSAYLPMDETLARVVIDFSGRPFLEYRAPQGVASIGAFSFSSWRNSCAPSPSTPAQICTSKSSTAATPITWPRPFSKAWPKPWIKRASSIRAWRACRARRGPSESSGE